MKPDGVVKVCCARLISLALPRVLLLLICGCISKPLYAIDLRAYQHGVDFIKLPVSGYRLFWSSSPGDPPQGIKKVMLPKGVKCEYFVHDIYSSLIYSAQTPIQATSLVSMQEAQEPVSAAIAANNHIMLTFEDGSEGDVVRNCDGDVQQRYQLYDAFLQPITEIKTVSVRGGHSGHVATVGEYFVIAYAEGWVDGGGIDDAGTANDIHIDVVDMQGTHIRHRGIAIDKGSHRDWWPLIAGSAHSALLVWQRFVDGETYADLMYSVYDPTNDHIVKETTLLKSKLNYYHYDVQYLRNIDRYLIVGNYLVNAIVDSSNVKIPVMSPRLFAFILDGNGKLVGQWSDGIACQQCGSYHFYNIVREAQPAVLEEDNQSVKVLYPVKPNGFVLLTITATKITNARYLDAGHYWFPLGSDGIFTNKHTAYFVNLTPTGLKNVTINVDP